jgi:signal transduction histidine kinase
VELNHGTLTIVSKPGDGYQLTILFPLIKPV